MAEDCSTYKYNIAGKDGKDKERGVFENDLTWLRSSRFAVGDEGPWKCRTDVGAAWETLEGTICLVKPTPKGDTFLHTIKNSKGNGGTPFLESNVMRIKKE